jgi:hypothetical protein
MLPYINFNESLPDAIGRLGGRLAAVVVSEPARMPSSGGIEALLTVLGRGGTLILLGGYESPKAARDLCAQFGFWFDNMPIGRISPTQDPEMAFWNACPVLPVPADAEHEALVKIWGQPVVARQELLAGEVVAFGDSDFLKNKNLEDIESYRAGNVRFVEDLLDRALELHAKGDN